jgi:hypothetical protein
MKPEKVIRVFIGYDSTIRVPAHVLAHSIQARSSLPVSVTYLKLDQLKSDFTRERDPLQSTEFSFSRFLVPYLCNYEGWSLFLDNDMLCLADIAELWQLRNPRYALQVVKHQHEAETGTKFLGRPQTPYQKKNWSSVMLFNNTKCQFLTPQLVNTSTGLNLHQFKWLNTDDLIGDLPPEWNHLVGVNPPRSDAKLAHYTLGGPYFDETKECEFSNEWWAEFFEMEKL